MLSRTTPCESQVHWSMHVPLSLLFTFICRISSQTQHERHENQQLRNENDKLRAENIRYREALSNTSCPNCGGQTTPGEMSFDEQQLRIENVRLREEVTLFLPLSSPPTARKI